MHPRTLTQVGQSCSGSSKQTSSTMELITVSKIKFYLQPWHTHTHMNKHYIPHVCTQIFGMRSLACLFGSIIFARIFCFPEGQKMLHKILNLFLWEENPEVKGSGVRVESSEMSLWETGIPKWSVVEEQWKNDKCTEIHVHLRVNLLFIPTL